MGLLADFVKQGDQHKVADYLMNTKLNNPMQCINEELAIHHLIMAVYTKNIDSHIDILEFLLSYDPDIYLRDNLGASILDLAVNYAIHAIQNNRDDILKVYKSIIQIILTKEASLRQVDSTQTTLLFMKDSAKFSPVDTLEIACKRSSNKAAVEDLRAFILNYHVNTKKEIVQKSEDKVSAAGLRHRIPAKTSTATQKKVSTQVASKIVPPSTFGQINQFISYLAAPIFSFWNSGSTPSTKEISKPSHDDHNLRAKT